MTDFPVFLLGKKKKGKGKTVALHEFLADTKVGGNVVEPPKRTTSWADATEEIDPVGMCVSERSVHVCVCVC